MGRGWQYVRSPSEWGKRLADRIRAALEAGDFESARRLALEGDGQARSLAEESALTYRGLGTTVRILLDLLDETVARRAADRESTRNQLATLLLRFRREVLEAMTGAYGWMSASGVADNRRMCDLVHRGIGRL